LPKILLPPKAFWAGWAGWPNKPGLGALLLAVLPGILKQSTKDRTERMSLTESTKTWRRLRCIVAKHAWLSRLRGVSAQWIGGVVCTEGAAAT
jgi:hypothetical protein